MTSPSHPGNAAVSAPGKVLLAGGYLVTDRAHTGLVLGLSARIHSYVRTVGSSNASEANEILVRSPQFRDAEWRYQYRVLDGNRGVEVHQSTDHLDNAPSRNKFIEVALTYTLNYVLHLQSLKLPALEVTILADSGYYSQSRTSSVCSKNPESPFLDFNIRLADANKTGLGSSAALVSALVSAILRYFLQVTGNDLPTDTFKARAHNLSQIAHCAAQGKIGSGFDVAAAVYGSCVYRRFSPSILEKVGEPGSAGFPTSLGVVVDDQSTDRLWDTQIDETAVDLPPRLRLVMCDVDCGSETPSMVKKVMSWRKEYPDDASVLWERIQQGIDELTIEFQKLCRDPGRPLETLRNIILANRSLVRDMSTRSKVPIEPDVQTELIDACSSVQGVVGGVVPGAGGYDAIALIIEHRAEVVQDLRTSLANFKSSNTKDHEVAIERVGMLNVQQESQGLRMEPTQQYAGWV